MAGIFGPNLVGPADGLGQFLGGGALPHQGQQVLHPLGQKPKLQVNKGQNFPVNTPMGHNEPVRALLAQLCQGFQIDLHGEGIGKLGPVEDPAGHHGIPHIEHIVRGPHADVIHRVPRRPHQAEGHPAQGDLPLLGQNDPVRQTGGTLQLWVLPKGPQGQIVVLQLQTQGPPQALPSAESGESNS